MVVKLVIIFYQTFCQAFYLVFFPIYQLKLYFKINKIIQLATCCHDSLTLTTLTYYETSKLILMNLF